MHKPIQIEHLSLSFPHKTCFESFSTEIHYGSRIAIIGRNGSGKSSLLNLLRGHGEASAGHIKIPRDAVIGYVPQVITEFTEHSGGERLNCALTQALSLQPNILLLDEPTNHLDERNRRQVLRLLAHFQGTLLVVSHDVALLRQSVDTFWHIDHGQIQIFTGSFDDYQHARVIQRTHLETSLQRLKSEQKALHQSLMQEQQRAAKSKAKGAKSISQRKWPTVVSRAKAGRSQETSGRKKAQLATKKQVVLSELAELNIAEVILPKFKLPGKLTSHTVLSINNGSIGYAQNQWLIQNIYLSVMAGQRVALLGENGSGKSTLFKAVLSKLEIIRNGEWLLPKPDRIGYLDQHYHTLCPTESVLTSMNHPMPDASLKDIRHHLSDFLFRRPEELNMPIAQLSGGEKARLSLAHIAAETPELLLLDEVTNNLDLETRQHVIEVLKKYPGSLLAISHDRDFLQEIGIQDYYEIREGAIFECM